MGKGEEVSFCELNYGFNVTNTPPIGYYCHGVRFKFSSMPGTSYIFGEEPFLCWRKKGLVFPNNPFIQLNEHTPTINTDIMWLTYGIYKSIQNTDKSTCL